MTKAPDEPRPLPAAQKHPLDNVVWQALATRQACFSQVAGAVRRFLPEIGPLAGFAAPDEPDYEALARLAGSGFIAIFLDAPFATRPGWKVVGGAPLVQMVWQGTELPETPAPEPIVRLRAADSAEMIELTNLTKPGPFGARTHELGDFYGVRIGGKLAAMAGERMKVDGHTEVSAVCTHPEHLGKGYAAALMRAVMRGIRARGETPFLHSRADNARAIGLYEKLGFRHRFAGHFVVLARD